MTGRALWVRLVAAVAIVGGGMLVVSSSGRLRTPPRHTAIRVRAGRVALRAVRAGRGPSVVLLHGYGESLLAWSGVFDRLAQHADVVALDLPGFGLSDKPSTGYSDTAMAHAVLDAMTSLGIAHATLVGHSMGGAVAITTALEAPARVDGLVLLDPAVSATTWGFKPPAGSGGRADWMRAAIASYETIRPRFNPPHDPDWLAESPAALAYSPAADTAYRTALEAVLREFDFDYLTPARASGLGQHVLLIWGEFDQVVPPAVGRMLAQGLPHARLVVVPRSLHRPHVERPDTVAGLIEAYLEQNDSL